MYLLHRVYFFSLCISVLLSAYGIGTVPLYAALDPLGCTALSDVELRTYGYEPVRAHGAVGDNATDDTAAIQAAIDAANLARRVVYFHPGTYLVSDTLEVMQDEFNTYGNDNDGRYGQTLQGSYCGNDRPTIRLADGVATTTNEQVVSGEPVPVISLWRDSSTGSAPDNTDGGRDWNQVVRNLKIVVGANPGAVGIRHMGAEGSSVQEVYIDATGAFAGLYGVNSSGGYTYNVTVEGGKYGIYIPNARGGSLVFVGITLFDQENTPIVNDHYTPLTLVGFDITHDDGYIVSSLTGTEGSFVVSNTLLNNSHDSGGHLALVDGRIDITGGPVTLLDTVQNDRSLYLSHVYLRGVGTILQTPAGRGNLLVADSAVWTHVGELAYGGAYDTLYGEDSMLVQGVQSTDIFHDGATYSGASDVAVATEGSPPATLVTQHLYTAPLCNVEATGMVFVTDYGADPNTPGDDTAGIQAAIDAASSGSNRVFLPPGTVDGSGAILNAYTVSDTLALGSATRVCGPNRYATIIDATGWTPSVHSPVFRTPDDAEATTVLADLKIELPAVSGTYATGYDPYPYALLWRAGRNSVVRDVFFPRAWGDPGDRWTTIVTGNGGGRWYGTVQQGGYPPPDTDPGAAEVRPYESGGELLFSPEYRHLMIDGTTEPLTFYSFHCQHLTPPYGAQCEIRNASNVSIYGVKHEGASSPSTLQAIISSNPADMIPAWMFISTSTNIRIVGSEGLSESDTGRALIEVRGSEEVRLVHITRRGNGVAPSNAIVSQDAWYFVEETASSSTHTVTAQGVLSFFLSTDSRAPVLAHSAGVSSPTTDTTPSYVFSTTEAGTVTYGGSCVGDRSTVAAGSVTVVFTPLPVGTYSDCTIQVVDSAGNASNVLTIAPFTIVAGGGGSLLRPLSTALESVVQGSATNTPSTTISSSTSRWVHALTYERASGTSAWQDATTGEYGMPYFTWRGISAMLMKLYQAQDMLVVVVGSGSTYQEIAPEGKLYQDGVWVPITYVGTGPRNAQGKYVGRAYYIVRAGDVRSPATMFLAQVSMTLPLCDTSACTLRDTWIIQARDPER